MQRSLSTCGLALLGFLAVVSSAEGQQYPLAPTVQTGETMHPFFEGWYENADGTKSFSFGYFNRNTRDLYMHIPRGPDNRIEPAQFDGMQPEHFTTRRERGIFVVTVPADWDFAEPVTWYIQNQGQEFSVPATWRSEAYQLSETMAMGSRPPFLRFTEDGEESWGLVDPLWAEPQETSVGEAIELRVWGRDHVSEGSPRAAEDPEPINVTIFTHHGPAQATVVAVRPEPEEPTAEEAGPASRFNRGPAPNEHELPSGSLDPAVFTVTFDQPGEYLLRVLVDNNGAVDSSPGDQCCWSNGYVPVTVSP